MSDERPPDPELPPTHRRYGRRDDPPFASPSGPAAPDTGPEYAAPSSQPEQYGQPGQPAYQPYAPPYGPPQPTPYGYGGPVLPDHPQAQTAFVVGLVALAGGLFCWLPLFVGPWAWIAGARARREIDRQPGQYAGRDKATAGMVMGIIASVLLGLAVVGLGILVLAVVVAAG